jgi:hypothetical protein
MASPFDKQIQNRNFLSPIGFNFVLSKYPKVDFFSNSINLPEISLATQVQPSYLKNIDIPGEKITYSDLRVSFIIDENMDNYTTIHNWITGLGFPETTEQFSNLITYEEILDQKLAFSDASLKILNSNYRTVKTIKFKDVYPVSLTSLDFTSTDNDYQYFTAQAVFKYTVYQITDENN